MIRPARFSDLHQIRYLAQTSTQPFIMMMGRKPAPVSADYRKLIEIGRLVVFAVETAVLGFMIAHADGPDVHVEAIAVVGKYRRQGLGRALLNHADVMGLGHGCRRVILYTNAMMFENITFFKSKGFQEVDRRTVDGVERLYLERYLR